MMTDRSVSDVSDGVKRLRVEVEVLGNYAGYLGRAALRCARPLYTAILSVHVAVEVGLAISRGIRMLVVSILCLQDGDWCRLS